MTRIKICGLKTIEDIQAVNRWKPDFAGFVFAPGKRQITLEQAAELRRALDSKIQAVGVFVNAPLEEATALADAGVIQLIQLHGEEDAVYMENLRRRTDKPLIKAVAARSREEILEAGQEDIRALADVAEAVLAAGQVCVIGSEEAIDAEKEMFGTVTRF